MVMIIAIVLSVVFFLSLKRKVIDKLEEPVRRME